MTYDFPGPAPIKLRLADSAGPVRNTALSNRVTTLNDLAKELSQRPAVGSKDGSYFVRGPLKPGATARGDNNIESASLLILDGDSTLDPQTGEITPGAPPPEQAHEALCQLGLAHILYTSWSHKQPGKGNRYRILIPAEIPDQTTLTACAGWAVAQLNQARIWLADVKENHTWSQPWYLPRLAHEGAEYLCLANLGGEA